MAQSNDFFAVLADAIEALILKPVAMLFGVLKEILCKLWSAMIE